MTHSHSDQQGPMQTGPWVTTCFCCFFADITPHYSSYWENHFIRLLIAAYWRLQQGHSRSLSPGTTSRVSQPFPRVGCLSDLERRWPGGSRSTRYRKAKLEQFAPYLLPDGLVTRLTTYTDLECKAHKTLIEQCLSEDFLHTESRLGSFTFHILTLTQVKKILR